MEFFGFKRKSNKDKSFKDKDKKSLGKEYDKQQAKSHNRHSHDQSDQRHSNSNKDKQLYTTYQRPSSTQHDVQTFSGENKPDHEGGKYQVTEVFKVQIPENRRADIRYEFLDTKQRTGSYLWGVDGMLIDEELLYAEAEEADRIYQELKSRSINRRNMETRENRLSYEIKQDFEDDQNLNLRQQRSLNDSSMSSKSGKDNKVTQVNQSFEKIRQFIKKSNQQERLEFTQGILNFANKIDKKFLTDGLLPNLEILVKEQNIEIRKALLDQFIPLIIYIREQCGQKGYDRAVVILFPMLDKLLYDASEQIRDKAISVLIEIRNVVQQKENDYIMNLTLKLAHDDNENNRISSLKILNELAPDMGQTLCESYIVPEIKSLSLDNSSQVRQTIARNMLNTSKIVSIDFFTAHIFPVYDRLTVDKDEKVRKACAEVVGDIAAVSPLEQKYQQLSDIYFRFLKDPTSKIVRGTAFQNIGPFISTMKELKKVDSRIVDFYISTTENSSNKDVCYYSSFNFPAFIYTLEKDAWPQFRNVYLKLSKFNDNRIKRTLAHSIHEIALICGEEITETDLVPVIERFLKDNFSEIKVGALKNLHIFLGECKPDTRQKFVQYISSAYNESQNDWRTKLVLAQNLGRFATLFDQDTVFHTFLPMFFKFTYDQVSKVGETAAQSLAFILEKFTSNEKKQEQIMKIIHRNFATAGTYKKRQLFVLMCGEAMNRKEIFDKYFKVDMMNLMTDKVSNVRLLVAKALKQHFLNFNGNYVKDVDINDCVKILKQDSNNDVRSAVLTIHTIDDDPLDVPTFLSKVQQLYLEIEGFGSLNEEMEMEDEINLLQIIEEASQQKQQHSDEKLRTSIYGEEMMNNSSSQQYSKSAENQFK